MADVVSYLEGKIEERHSKGWYDYWVVNNCLLNQTGAIPVETHGIGFSSYRQPPAVPSGMSPILVRPDFGDLDLPDILQSMTIDDILYAHMPYSPNAAKNKELGGSIVPLFGEGFEWDAWGSYQDHFDVAEKLGGVYTTIHDGDDDCDYLKIGGGTVNRYGAAVLTKESAELVKEWEKEKDFNTPARGAVESGHLSSGDFVVWSEGWCQERYCEDCEDTGFESYKTGEDRSKIFCWLCKKNIDDD
jgi:hypothetical protein